MWITRVPSIVPVAQLEAIYLPLSMFSPSITSQSAPKEIATIRAIFASLISRSVIPASPETGFECAQKPRQSACPSAIVCHCPLSLLSSCLSAFVHLIS